MLNLLLRSGLLSPPLAFCRSYAGFNAVTRATASDGGVWYPHTLTQGTCFYLYDKHVARHSKCH